MVEEFANPSEQVLKIDRRRLLTTSAAMTAASLAPDVTPTDAALVVSIQSGSTTTAPALKVCVRTAARLAEIERRNELRCEAKLPVLSIARELRRMKEEDDRQKFSEAFEPLIAKHSKAVWNEVLKPRREVLCDPNWKPKCWSEVVGYQGEVYRILRERFEMERERQKADISRLSSNVRFWG
jgi:hypothetical protein